MPFTFIAHQAPALAIKIAKPSWFCGTALAIGSMAPDLEYILRASILGTIGHTGAGQLIFCLPVTLALTYVVTQIVAEPAARHLPKGKPFYFGDYAALAVSARRPHYWLRAVPSALVGSGSHVVWDAFTHRDGFFALWWGYAPIVLITNERWGLTLVQALQHTSTLVGGACTLAMLAWIGRRGQLWRWLDAEPAPAPKIGPRERQAFWLPLAIASISGTLIACAIGLTASPGWVLQSWIEGFFHLIRWLFIGLVVGSVLARKQARRFTYS